MDYKFGYRYHIHKKIGHGSFGNIYIGLDEKQQKNVAIKIESVTSKHLQLAYEANIYKNLVDGIGIPRVYFYGTENVYNVMIMDLLGPNLEELLRYCNGAFSLKTVCMLAQEMILRVQFLHEHGYVHRDIKPDNFLIGLDQMANVIYLIDFGLCKQYKIQNTGEHISYRENKSLIGTLRYASIPNHLGIEQSRRDDLESLGYVLIYLLKGKLPWQGMKMDNKKDTHRRILEKKVQVSIPELCKGLPSGFQDYFNYSRNLFFDEEPDYGYLRSLFRNMMEEMGWKNDGVYDWMIETDNHVSERLPKYCLNERGEWLYDVDKPALRPFTEHMALADVRDLYVPDDLSTSRHSSVSLSMFDSNEEISERNVLSLENGSNMTMASSQALSSDVEKKQGMNIPSILPEIREDK